MPYLAIIIDSGLPIQIHLIVERIILDSITSVVKGMCGLIAACMLCIQYNLSIIILPNANLYSTFIPHGCCRQATGSTSTYKNLQLLDYFKNRSSMYRTDKNLLLNFLCWSLKCLVVLCNSRCRFYHFNNNNYYYSRKLSNSTQLSLDKLTILLLLQ